MDGIKIQWRKRDPAEKNLRLPRNQLKDTKTIARLLIIYLKLKHL